MDSGFPILPMGKPFGRLGLPGVNVIGDSKPGTLSIQ